MHAVILAGGQGVRLRPYTTCLPKPLVPIGNTYSILEIVLNQLHACGFRSATLAISHLGALIHAFSRLDSAAFLRTPRCSSGSRYVGDDSTSPFESASSQSRTAKRSSSL